MAGEMNLSAIVAAAVLVAAPVAGCSSDPRQSSSPPAGAAALSKVTLSYRPSGTTALSWDRQSKKITAKLQMAGFTPGATYAIDIHKGGCIRLGDVAVPFPDVTADGAGAINTSITSERLAPGGLLPRTALNQFDIQPVEQDVDSRHVGQRSCAGQRPRPTHWPRHM